MLRVNDRISIPFTEFDFTFARSGGPGGQNVNKVNSKVTLRWDVEKSPTLPPDVLARFRAKYPRRMTKDGELVMHSQRYRDQGRNVTKGAAMAKLAATEGAQQVIDAAVQVWGGLGVVSEQPVERLYREIRALRIYEGASEVQQLIIARELLKGMA